MRVPSTLTAPWQHARFPEGGARALQCPTPMPRKQRFKPSRKPQSTQGTVPSQQVDDRKDISPEQQRDISRETPVITADPEVE